MDGRARVVGAITAAAIVACAFPGGVGAQVSVFGGVNFAKLGDVDVSSVSQTFDNRGGFHVGAALSTGEGPISLRLGAMYLNAGALFDGASFLTADDFDVDYISFPLDLHLRSGMVYVFGGPEGSLLLVSDAPPDFEDDLKRWTLDGGLGAGVRVGPFFAEGRYALGLSGLTEDTFEVGGVTFVTSDQPRASVLRLTVGLAF